MTRQRLDQPMGADVPQNYERYFVPAIGRPLADDLLRVASLPVGERVLDVGCGTGVVTRLAAEHVGPEGVVAGVDLNPGMLETARSSTPRDLQIEWYEASAESMPLPDGVFDAVLCQLSLQFVADRLRALREMRRILTAGGRLVLNDAAEFRQVTVQAGTRALSLPAPRDFLWQYVRSTPLAGAVARADDAARAALER